MTMLDALDRAQEMGAFARPVGDSSYAYRWSTRGHPALRVTAAREPRRRWSVSSEPRTRYVEDDLCNVTRKMLVADWVVCRRDGEEV